MYGCCAFPPQLVCVCIGLALLPFGLIDLAMEARDFKLNSANILSDVFCSAFLLSELLDLL